MNEVKKEETAHSSEEKIDEIKKEESANSSEQKVALDTNDTQEAEEKIEKKESESSPVKGPELTEQSV